MGACAGALLARRAASSPRGEAAAKRSAEVIDGGEFSYDWKVRVLPQNLSGFFSEGTSPGGAGPAEAPPLPSGASQSTFLGSTPMGPFGSPRSLAEGIHRWLGWRGFARGGPRAMGGLLL